MPTFGAAVAASAWPILAAAGALTTIELAVVTTTTNIETGAITETVVAQTVQGKVSPFRPDEVDGQRVSAQDRKVLVQQADITTPLSLSTRVTMAGVVWHMQAPPEPVSNDGLWQLQVRRVGDV